MESLDQNATIDDIYEELAFLDVCEQSLDQGAENYLQEKAALEEKRRQYELRINTLAHPSSSRYSTNGSETNNDNGHGDDDELESDSPPPQFLSSGSKRPHPASQGLSRAPKRPTPEPSSRLASDSAFASASASRSHNERNGMNQSAAVRAYERARKRQEEAEAFLRKRREAEVRDAQFAHTLSQSTSPNTSFSSSRPNLQATIGQNGSFERPRLPTRPMASSSQLPASNPTSASNGYRHRSLHTSRPPPSWGIKSEHYALPTSSSLPSRSHNSAAQPAIVDLTGSDGDERPNHHATSRTPLRPPVRPQHNTGRAMPGAWPDYGHGSVAQPILPSTYVPSQGFASIRPPSTAPAYTQHMPQFNDWRAMNGFQPARVMQSDTAQLASLINRSPAGQPQMWHHPGMPYWIPDDYDSDDGGDTDDDILYGGSYRRGPFTTSNFGRYSGHEDLYQTRYDAIANYDPAKTQEEIQSLLENIRPDEDMPAHLRVQTPAAMAIQLHKYQELGLTWLQKCEIGTNKGGILADDMGLGKTIQMLSLIVTHRSEDPSCRTTLIVAPVALMRQWKQEIEHKVKPGSRLSVFIHHGQAKKSRFSDLKQFDVVLTTFGSVAAEVKKLEAFKVRQQNNPSATPTAKEKCVLIGDEALWYRAILDEAQCIKNKNTQTAKGANMIRAKYRFCMTGTPMMNNVNELYSLIRFLQIRPYNLWEKFRLDISMPLKSGSEQAMQRLQTLCKAIMLRRTKKSTFEGKPILVLPERTTEIDNPVFNEDELAIYQALEQQTALQFNKYFKEGTIGNKYSAILLLLLRLRQACCHPHLVRDFGVSAASDMTPDQLLELAEMLQPAVVARIKQKEGVFECPICFDAATNPAIFIPCGHDSCAECFAKITDPANGIAAGNENGTAQIKCPNCRNPIDVKKITDFESFKQVHQPELLTVKERKELKDAVKDEDDEDDDDDDDESDSSTGDDASDDSGSDDEKDQKDPTLGGFIVDDNDPIDSATESEDEDEDDLDLPSRKAKKSITSHRIKSEGEMKSELAEDEDTKHEQLADAVKPNDEKPLKDNKAKKKGKTAKRRRGKGKKKEDGKTKKERKAVTLGELKKRASRSVADKKKYLRRLREDWISSAKIDKTLDLLTEIMSDPVGEKVLIFSQWTSFLDLLEVPIDGNGWGYRRYDGSMNAGMRSDAIDDFRDLRKNVRIMLVSLKAGNAGLNLNMASQVIILDPFWNPFIEEQAIDRAHRLGQTRPVTVHRLLVPDTVEDRICKLQEEKRELISQALDERAGQSISRLGIQELSYLFGLSSNLRPSAAAAAPSSTTNTPANTRAGASASVHRSGR